MTHLEEFSNYLTYEKRYSPLTIELYTKTLLRYEGFLSKLEQEPGLADAKRKHIKLFIYYQVERGLAPQSINLSLSILRSFYGYLHRMEKIPEKPTKYIVNLRAPKLLPKFLQEKDINYLLDNLEVSKGFPGLRDKTLLELFYGTGIRLAELTTLKTTGYNPEKQTIKVTGKGQIERIVPLLPQLARMLNYYISIKERLFPESVHLMVNNSGNPCSSAIVYRIVNKYLCMITQDQASPHVIRHSYATHLMDAGANLKAIKDLLGHQTLLTTQIYLHTSITHLKNAHQRAHPKK